MTAVSVFKADPIDFLEKNIVMQEVGGTAVKGSTGTFTLKEVTSKSGVLFDKTSTCKVYQMVQGTGSDTFTAYWCPYEDEKAMSVTLSDKADLMFTANMTGCSFGVGIKGSDGSVRVAHANVQESSQLQQIGEAMYSAFDPKLKGPSKEMAFLEAKKYCIKEGQQGVLLSGPTGVDGKVTSSINPGMYRGLSATTFGVRDGTNGWKFYFHTYERNGSNLRLFGVFPFPNQ